MFSLECLAIALSIFPLLHTHAAPHQANEKGVVQEIVESRDSAVILFGRAQNMFALLFDDFDITLLNNDNRTIIASGRAKIGDYIRNNYDSNYRMVSFITYKIKIDCKDYKYRYSISDIKITTFSNLFETPQFDWISFWCAWSDYGLINTPYFTYGNAKIKTEIYSYTISEIYASYQRDSAVISKYDEAAKLYYAALNKTKRKSDPGEYIAAANDSQSDTMRHRCYACFALIRLFINMPGCHDLRCGLRGHPVYRVASPGNTDADKIPFPAISG